MNTKVYTQSVKSGKGKGNAGFSLVELLVVIAILAILATIAIPLFLNQKNKAAVGAVKADVRNLATSIHTQTLQPLPFQIVGASVTDDAQVETFTINGGVVENKNGAKVFISTSGDWCVSKTAESGVVVTATKSRREPYVSYTPCIEPTSTPVESVSGKPFAPFTAATIIGYDMKNPTSYPGSGVTITDLSGNNTHATLSGDYTVNPAGGINFGGVSGTAVSNYPVSNLKPSSSFTMSVWAKFDTRTPTATTNNGVLWGAAYYSGAGIYWRTTDGLNFQVYGFLRSSTSLRQAVAPTAITSGSVRNLVVVNEQPSNRLKLYLDGEIVADITSTNAEYTAANVSLAGNVGLSKRQVDGGGSETYSNFAGTVFNASTQLIALTADQVKANYEALKNEYS